MELQKLSKAASNAFAKNTTLEITNEALLEKDGEMKKRAQRSNKQLGKGQIMGQEVLEERRANAQFSKDEKEYWDIWKDVGKLFKEDKLTKAASLVEERRAIALSKQNEKTHWDIWKDVILLFKEPKPKATRGKAKALEEEVILEAESSSEMENLSTGMDTTVEPVGERLETIQEMESEEVVRTSRSGRILRPSTRH